MSSIILERNTQAGGLCSSFEIDGFRFDRFVHLSFSNDPCVNDIFLKNEFITHIPNPANIYNRTWIKHPAQNNLYPLPQEEKETIINDFRRRQPVEQLGDLSQANYEDWLRCQFGDYFAEHFPMAYTKKYWMKPACELRTEWVGNRIYQPSIDEVIAGSQHEDERVTYYAKEMRYPKGGIILYSSRLLMKSI